MAVRPVVAVGRVHTEEITMKKHLMVGIAAAALFAGLLGACSSDDDAEDTSTQDTEQTTDDSVAEAPSDEAPAEGAAVSTATTELGEVLVDDAGISLYAFTEDADGVPTCEGACADAWPPLTVEGSELPDGLDAAVFSVVEAPDGSFQLAAGGHPLYRFAGDSGPGSIAGQGSGGVWFLVDPAGELVELQVGEAPAEGTEDTEAPETTETTSAYDY
jgi:predicted lipoprotein with Yx(FWY)xxD motif